MRVTVFGSGYVGLVTGACLADEGNHVVSVDIDAAKVALLNSGRVPIHEPGPEAIVASSRSAGQLTFTTDIAAGVEHGEVLFIAVGTPPDETGSADLKYVLSVARSIGAHFTGFKVVADKSAVPVGTGDRVAEAITGRLPLGGPGLMLYQWGGYD